MNVMGQGKKISRRTNGAYAVLYQKARPVVVTLRPGDVLEFRELGRRQRWHLAVDTAFRYAVRCQALAEAREKRGKR